MGNFSKYFHEVLKDKTCADVIHPGKSCTQAKFDVMLVMLSGVAKFYLPVFLIPQLAKFEWTKEFFRKLGKFALHGIIGGFIGPFLSMASFCILFDYLKYHYYQFFIIPLFIGGANTAVGMPSSFIEVLASGSAHHVIEYIFEASMGNVLNKLQSNVTLSTLVFMTLSSSIVYLFKTTRHRPVWLLHVPQPEKVELACDLEMEENSQKPGWFDSIIPREQKICKHTDSCELFLWKEVKKIAKIGAIISLAKSLVAGYGELKKARFMQIPGIIKKNIELSSWVFIVLYCGSFKFINCLLNRRFKKDSTKNAVMAGYCSGLCYIFYPKFGLISFALIRVSQLLWLKHVNDYNGESEAVKILRQMPMAYIIASLSITFVFTTRAIYPHLSSKYVKMALRYLSGTLSDSIMVNFYGILMGLQ